MLQQHCLEDLQPPPAPHHPCTEGTEAAWPHCSPQEGRSPPCQKVQRVRPYWRDMAYLPRKRRRNAVLSAPWGVASGTADSRLSADLSKRSFTLPYKTPCDFEITTVIMEQAQKSSDFPRPQEFLPALYLQVFLVLQRSLHLKHHFHNWIHRSYRGNYFTATIPLEPHRALTQKLKHHPHLWALQSACAVSTQSPLQTDREAAPPPAARALAGFSPTGSGSGQLSPSRKQSLETTTEANPSLRIKATGPTFLT